MKHNLAGALVSAGPVVNMETITGNNFTWTVNLTFMMVYSAKHSCLYLTVSLNFRSTVVKHGTTTDEDHWFIDIFNVIRVMKWYKCKINTIFSPF